MNEKALRRYAQNSRAHLKTLYENLKILVPNLPPIQSLTDEQVFRILQRVSHMDSELATINVITTSAFFTIQAEENPFEYHQLVFPSVN